MATLKGAYQRFVSSIVRLWRRENNNNNKAEEANDREDSSSSVFLDLDDDKSSDSATTTQEDLNTSNSAPDLLESTQKSPVRKFIPQNRRLSILKNAQNSSTPNLPELKFRRKSSRRESTPEIIRKRSGPSLFRPISFAVDTPIFTEYSSPNPSPVRPTLVRIQPPTPESSPRLPRRYSNNLLCDHPPVVLRRQLTSKPYPLRRQNSSDSLLHSSTGQPSPTVNQRRKKPRPKSVSDIFLPEYQQKPGKIKKSTSFLKLSPVFRRSPSPKHPNIVEEKEPVKQPDTRQRTLTLASRFTKFATKTFDGTLRKRAKSDPKSRKIVRMTKIETASDKTMPVEPFMARLRDYNTYYEGRSPQQFKWKQDKDGNHVVDGNLNIYWGLKKAIRLQMQDSSVKIRPQSDLAAAQADAVRRFEEKTTGVPVGEESVELVMKNDKLSGTLLRRRISNAIEKMNEEGSDSVINVENGILGETRQRTYDRRRMALKLRNGGEKVHVSTEDENGMMRQKSVILRKRMNNRSARKRFSINGHAYNHRTSVFTPAYASVTNVRVTSKSTCDDVIKHLLYKFRIENSFEDFSLYIVKETGERRELSRNEYPLVTRVLAGPNEQVCKIFVMDRNMHEDISSDVAQYYKLDTNILEMFVKKFSEEEDRQVKRLKERYEMYRKMLEQRIQESS